jgi:hypothetical protein
VTITSKTSSYDLEGARTPCGDQGATPSPDDGRGAAPSDAIERPRPKVVPLRGRGAPVAMAEVPGTPSFRLDLQVPIDNLRSIKGDLELYYWERPAAHEQQESERYQVSLWIRQVSERASMLEGILLHMGTPSIVLPPASAVEREALRSATALLGCWIRDDEPFGHVLHTVAAILNAADVIGLAAAGGRPEPSVRRPPAT